MNRVLNKDMDSRRSGRMLWLVLLVGLLPGVEFVAVRTAQAGIMQDEPPQIDDGLTDEEREFINRPITQMNEEEKQRRDQILAKMRDHIVKVMEAKEKQKERGTVQPPRGREQQPAEPADQPETTKPKQRPETPKRPPRNKPAERKTTPRRGTPATQTPTPAVQTPPVGAPATFTPPSDAEPPAEPEGNQALAFDQRLYSFGLKNGNYIDLVEMFARKTGLPVLGLPIKPPLGGELPENSVLTYVSAELTDFRTTMHQINDLLFFQITPPLYLYYDVKEKRLKLDMFKELRVKLPPSRLFMSLEAVKEAVSRGELMDSDIVRVFFAPRSEAEMKTFNDIVAGMFGEQVLMSLSPDTGRIDFTGRVDILRRVEEYLERIVFEEGSVGGEIHVLTVKHIRPSEAVEKLVQLVENVIGSAEEVSGAAAVRRGRGAPEEPELLLEGEKVLVIADDTRKVLLVKGLPYKVNEVKVRLDLIDRPISKDATPLPVVLKLRHAEAEIVAEQLNAIVNAGSAPPMPRPARGKKAQAPPEAAVGGSEALRVIPEPRSNSLILQGPDEVVALAQRIVEEILDTPSGQDNFRAIALQHRNAQDIVDEVQELMGGNKPERGEEQLKMIPSGDSVLLKGTAVEMSEAEELIHVLDVKVEYLDQMFVAHVKNATPSKVVEVLVLTDQQHSGGAPDKPKKGRAALAGTRYIPDDNTGAIYFFGTQREWENKIVPVIEMVDGEQVEASKVTLLELKHANPDEVVGKLTTLFPGGGKPRGGAPSEGARFTSTPLGIIVGGEVTAAELASIRETATLLDVATGEMETRTFELKYANPEIVAEKIQDLFASSAVGAPRRGRPAKGEAPSPTGEPVAMKVATTAKGLIVIAPKADMPQIASMVEMLDQEGVAVKVETRPFPITHAQADVVAALLEPILEAKMAESLANQPAGEKGKAPRAAEAALSVDVDTRTNTVLVTAAQPLLEYAAQQIRVIDGFKEEKPKIHKIYDCLNSRAEDLADLLTAMYGGEGGGVKLPSAPKPEGKPAGAEGGAGAKRARDRILKHAAEGGGGNGLEILPLPGDKAISIHGPVDLVEQVYARAGELDAKSAATENTSKTFTLKWADVEEVADAIISMLDKPVGRSAAAAPKAKGAAAEEEVFFAEPKGPKVGTEISVWPRYDTRTIIVYAPPVKMVAVEALIAECERLADPETEIEPVAAPYEFYPLKFLSAYEALKLAEAYIESIYPTAPPVKLDYIDKKTLVLKGTRKYFAEIMDLIAKHVDTRETLDRMPPAITVGSIPSHLQQQEFIKRLQTYMGDVDIEVQDLTDLPGRVPVGSIQEIE